MDVIIDSALSIRDAIKQNPALPCPPDILARQKLITVRYYSFDGNIHQGQIVVDEDLVTDVKDAFILLLQEKFPITSVIPIADPKFYWDDILSMKADNSSGFNYRVKTVGKELSNHAFGRAIDINPFINPYISRTGVVIPHGALYDTTKPGAIIADSMIVKFFLSRGWEWGGNWTDRKDYQHFQKPK